MLSRLIQPLILAVLLVASGSARAQSPVIGLAGQTGSSPVFWPTTSGSPVFGLAPATPKLSAWPMNEGSGLTLHDVSGNANTATISGPTAVTWQSNSGIPGVTPLWNGVGTAVVSNAALTNFDGTKPFSVTGWIKTTQSSQSALLSTLNPAANFQGWEIQNGAGSVGGRIQFLMFNNFSTNNGIFLRGNTNIIDGGLHFFTLTYDGSKTAAGVKIYIDGVQDTIAITTDGLTGSTASTVPLHIGGRSNTTSEYVGAMAFVEIVPFVWTQAQVTANFAKGPAIY